MALKDLLTAARSARRTLTGRLRQHLVADERVEERGGARGWTPQPTVADAPAAGLPPGERGRDARTGGPLRDLPAADTSQLPLWTPDAGALAAYEAGAVWDLSAELAALVSRAEASGATDLLLCFTLSHCQWSDRAAQAVARAAPGLTGRAEGAVARAGDRLAKVYFRDVRLGRATVSLPSFPLTLCLHREADGLSLRALALEPLGPDPDDARVRALLDGRSLVAPGSDHFALTVCTGALCARVDGASGWAWGGRLG